MKKYILMSALLAASGALYAQTGAAAQPAAKPGTQGTAPAAAKAEQQAQKPAAPAVKVDKLVIASSVENRTPQGEAATFPADTKNVFTWTRVTAESVPAKIKHVYYADGKKVAEVELAINGSPYRVWSSKLVRPGSWKVEVQDEDGAVLASSEFTVTPEAAPAAKAGTQPEEKPAPEKAAPEKTAPAKAAQTGSK